jgi:pentatricopeptide repeat protein
VGKEFRRGNSMTGAARLSAILLQRARILQYSASWLSAPALPKLGVVEHYTWLSQQERGDVSIGQRERSYSSAAPSAAYTARNYASNIAEYNRKLLEINNSRRAYLMRDIYEDMQIDGVQPVRDTFHTLISGCMKGDRLQDVMYFFEEMKAMGLAPDVSITCQLLCTMTLELPPAVPMKCRIPSIVAILVGMHFIALLIVQVAIYNSVILSCGRCNQIDHAFQVAEEMESNGIPPKHRTFLALLKSCGIAGRVDEAYGVPPPWAREILLG